MTRESVLATGRVRLTITGSQELPVEVAADLTRRARRLGFQAIVEGHQVGKEFELPPSPSPLAEWVIFGGLMTILVVSRSSVQEYFEDTDSEFSSRGLAKTLDILHGHAQYAHNSNSHRNWIGPLLNNGITPENCCPLRVPREGHYGDYTYPDGTMVLTWLEHLILPASLIAFADMDYKDMRLRFAGRIGPTRYAQIQALAAKLKADLNGHDLQELGEQV